MLTLKDVIGNIHHPNKKLVWSVLPNGNYLLANRSTKKPISFEFSPNAPTRKIVCNTRAEDRVYFISTNSRKVVFEHRS